MPRPKAEQMMRKPEQQKNCCQLALGWWVGGGTSLWIAGFGGGRVERGGAMSKYIANAMPSIWSAHAF